MEMFVCNITNHKKQENVFKIFCYVTPQQQFPSFKSLIFKTTSIFFLRFCSYMLAFSIVFLEIETKEEGVINVEISVELKSTIF